MPELSDIEIFTGPGCRHCEAAKELLRARGLPFAERDVSDPEVMLELRERLPQSKTIPQVFANGDYLGNEQDLRERLKG